MLLWFIVFSSCLSSCQTFKTFEREKSLAQIIVRLLLVYFKMYHVMLDLHGAIHIAIQSLLY